MKIFIEMGEKYLLLTDKLESDNLEENYLKQEFINNVMDRLEQMKMSMELKRQAEKNKVKMLKIGVHPYMGKGA